MGYLCPRNHPDCNGAADQHAAAADKHAATANSGSVADAAAKPNTTADRYKDTARSADIDESSTHEHLACTHLDVYLYGVLAKRVHPSRNHTSRPIAGS